MCLRSKFVVGSSKARISHLTQKAFAKANLIVMEARTLYPILDLPFISSYLPFLLIKTIL